MLGKRDSEPDDFVACSPGLRRQDDVLPEGKIDFRFEALKPYLKASA